MTREKIGVVLLARSYFECFSFVHAALFYIAHLASLADKFCRGAKGFLLAGINYAEAHYDYAEAHYGWAIATIKFSDSGYKTWRPSA